MCTDTIFPSSVFRSKCTPTDPSGAWKLTTVLTVPLNAFSVARSYFAPDCAAARADAATTSTALMKWRRMTYLLKADDPLIEFRTIGAERFLGEEAAGRGIRARTAPAADGDVAAVAALAFVLVGIAQLLEHARVVPDVGEPLDARVAGRGRQVPAGIHRPFVRDEADARSRQAAARHRRQRLLTAGVARRRAVAVAHHLRRRLGLRPRRDEGAAEVAARAFVLEALRADAVVVRRARGLQIDRTVPRLLVEPVEHALVLVGRQHLGGRDLDPAPDRNEHEQMERVGAELQREVEHRRHFVDVVLRDGRVDLHRDPLAAEVADAAQRQLVGARQPAEAVVGVAARN